MIKKLYVRLCKYEDYYIPFVFVLPGIINAMLYYTGFAYRENPIKSALYATFNILFLFMTVSIIGFKAIKKEYSLPRLAICATFTVFNGICLLYAIINFNFLPITVTTLIHFSVFAFPAALWGLEFGARPNYRLLLRNLEQVGICMIPLAVPYCVIHLIRANPFKWFRIGALNYHDIGTALLPFLLASVIAFALNEFDYADLKFLSKFKIGRHARLFVIILFWTAISLTNHRSTIVSVFFFLALFTVFTLVKCIRRMTSFILSVFLIILFIAVHTFAVANADHSRFTNFINGLMEGRLTTSRDAREVEENILKMVQSDDRFLLSDVREEEPQSSRPSEDDEDDIDVTKIAGRIQDRGTIYRLAWLEARENPLTGLSPLGFTAKYGGLYPHNAALEALADLGFVFGGMLLLFFTACALKLLHILVYGQRYAGLTVVFLAGLILPIMIGGTLWSSSILCFCVCFSISVKNSS